VPRDYAGSVSVIVLVCAALTSAVGATKQDTKPATSQTTSHETPYICNFARVHHLNAGEHLAVRSGPRLHFPKVDQLEAGKPVYICDERGDWLRIFYGDKNSPCGTAFPGGIDVRKSATCRSGWVSRKWIDVLSG
jgi:uncharacterized protein YgiM (DUF1202 family)